MSVVKSYRAKTSKTGEQLDDEFFEKLMPNHEHLTPEQLKELKKINRELRYYIRDKKYESES